MWRLACLLVSTILILASPALAAPRAVMPSEVATFVTPPERPTPVAVGLFLQGLTGVSSSTDPFPVFSAELLLSMRWQDPRLAYDPLEVGVEREVFQGDGALRVLQQVWHPDLHLQNEQGSRDLESIEIIVYPDGGVRLVERFHATVHADLDLRRFPFDEQDFRIHLESFAWDAEHVVLELDPDRTGFDADHHTLEWTVDRVDGEVRLASRSRSQRPFSDLVITIHASRIPGFYIWKLIVPLMVIVFFTWTAFWMEHEAAAPRMQRSFISLLSVVAFQHIVAQHQPKIGYLTLLDAVVYLAFLSVGATLVLIAAEHNAAREGDDAWIGRVDRFARFAFPIGFLLAGLLLWLVYR